MSTTEEGRYMEANLRSPSNLDVRGLLARTWSDRLSPQQIDALAVQILSAQLDKRAAHEWRKESI